MESLGVHGAVRGLAVKSSELRDFGLGFKGLGPGGVGAQGLTLKVASLG